MVFLENQQATSVVLDGEWRFSLAGGAWQSVRVPAAWETYTTDKITDGPALYRRQLNVTAGMLEGRHLILEFAAVSFWASVRVNGVQVATHRGMWSPFQVDISRHARLGSNELEIEAWKPGQRFPIRESLAGFLPDVITVFGGIWQGVQLLAVDAAISELKVLARVGSQLSVTGALAGLDEMSGAEVEIDLDGAERASVRVDPKTGTFQAELDLRDLARWRPAAPALHRLTLSAWQHGQCLAHASRTIGLRDVAIRDGSLWLDDDPLHLRGVLDWGWQPELIRPAPSGPAVMRQIEQSRALGFNLIKLCLYVPDEASFDAADQAGQFLWVEMPMWLPHLTAEARDLARQEYEAIFRRVHHHPSIVALSLGCELNAEADAEFLAELHALARAWFPNAIVCDNSGSAEAYGGVTTALQDFYDYHFYTDPHFFGPLIDHFERSYRPRRPWLFGEFCDADTGRDYSALGRKPWWLTQPVALDRDDFRYTREYEARLAAAGIADGGAVLTRIARRQATAVRKIILEQTRLHFATGGYVVTGWADTPITTSGVVDDAGRIKFDGNEWQRFNADGVLLLERDRRRRWAAGGDRPAYRDPFTWRAGEPGEARLLLSNALGRVDEGRLEWRLVDAFGKLLGSAVAAIGPVPPGQVCELAALRLPLPGAEGAPAELLLQVDLTVRLADGTQRHVQNQWPLWVVPATSLGAVLGLVDFEAVTSRHDLAGLSPATRLVQADEAPASAPVLACDCSKELLDLVRSGRNAVVWFDRPDGRMTRGLPFWREAIHVFEPHPLWSRAPHPGFADMRFFGVASDLALDLAGLQDRLGPEAKCWPIWRRFDARALTWAEYLVEIEFGRGRLFVATLRFAGGLGCQPEGLRSNPWGAWMLAALLRAAGQGGL